MNFLFVKHREKVTICQKKVRVLLFFLLIIIGSVISFFFRCVRWEKKLFPKFLFLNFHPVVVRQVIV